MMKLSTMKKVVETVDQNWKSPLAEKILKNWGYDKDTIFYYRASANFIFVFQKEGEYYFLRFSDSIEKDLPSIESELKILKYLRSQALNVAEPVISLNDNLIETIQTDEGTYYAVVFKAIDGKHMELEELTIEQFHIWGSNLGKLHHALKEMPADLHTSRSSWKEQLLYIKENLPTEEHAAWKELQAIEVWFNGLHINKDNYGVIHYDFELDNLRWQQDELGMLDFDDSTLHWYVADIAYALRDLFLDKLDKNDVRYLAFISGYEKETDIDYSLLKGLNWFLRMHRLITFVKLLETVDINDDNIREERLINLSKKLSNYIIKYRERFISYLNI